MSLYIVTTSVGFYVFFNSGSGPADFNVRVFYKVVSAIGLSSFALSFFHQPVPSPLYNKASVECIYIFAGERGGDCKQHRTVMCKNAGLYNVQEPVR